MLTELKLKLEIARSQHHGLDELYPLRIILKLHPLFLQNPNLLFLSALMPPFSHL